jgi:PERQ amino acid-rich with GYF domain-containing protein
MSTATMHFGPEWMRTKNQPLLRSQQQPSPPPANPLPQAPSTLATYSALVSITPVAPEKLDESHPFRYSKEELLTIYQEGGGKGRLGLEVERWEGVVREVAVEPITLREMTDAEKKVCCC